MANEQSEWERDAEWFRKNFPMIATDDEVDAFCERVSIKIWDSHMSESRARFETLSDLRKIRNATQG